MKFLITGGAGSFGQAFTEHLLKNNLSERIVIYSRCEVRQAEMRERFNDKRLRFIIGDVRDVENLKRACRGVQTIIHAAALKRIEVGQYCPDEVIKTNINGTMNIITASNEALNVVLLSTDKAWRPVSPYGCSKALAESLILNANNMNLGPRFAVTRYGNVAGSRGSVIPKWKAMGDAVPVSDPDCTRFWMWMSEAVDLVYNAIGTTGLHIPKLPAYRLGDLAEAMGKIMSIKGLPDWEKQHEGMADGNTSDVARRLSVAELRAMIAQLNDK